MRHTALFACIIALIACALLPRAMGADKERPYEIKACPSGLYEFAANIKQVREVRGTNEVDDEFIFSIQFEAAMEQSGKNWKATCNITKFTCSLSNGKTKLSTDSESVAKGSLPASSLEEALAAVVGGEFTFTVAANGAMSKFAGLSKLFAKAVSKAKPTQEEGAWIGLLKDMFNEQLWQAVTLNLLTPALACPSATTLQWEYKLDLPKCEWLPFALKETLTARDAGNKSSAIQGMTGGFETATAEYAKDTLSKGSEGYTTGYNTNVYYNDTDGYIAGADFSYNYKERSKLDNNFININRKVNLHWAVLAPKKAEK